MGFWVRATQTGYHGMQRRRGPVGDTPGERFYLDSVVAKDKETGRMVTISAEQQFSSKWMKKVSAPRRDEDDDEVTTSGSENRPGSAGKKGGTGKHGGPRKEAEAGSRDSDSERV